MITIGLTGSIGMGKSTTAGLFAEAGLPVYDADAAVHALYRQDGDAVPKIAAAFPDVVVNNAVDRQRLSALLAAQPERWASLEAIVHPLLGAQRQAFLDQARQRGADIVVLDIPLLFETRTESSVDVIVVVSAPEAVQRARVLERPGMTEAKLEAILSRQTPDSQKRERAHFVIDTEAGVERAQAQVLEIIQSVRSRLGPLAAQGKHPQD